MRPRRTSGVSCDLARSVEDPRAFEHVYDAYSTRVLAFLARRTFDAEAARDLMAETFAQAYQGRRRFRGSTDDEAAAWLYGIARNLLNRYIRTGVIERRAVERLGIRVPQLVEADYERIVQLAGLADIRAVVAEEFGKLRPDQQRAVHLRVVEELSYPEIATCLAISEQTARARVSRGLRQLVSGVEGLPDLRERLA
jgi:RNA polymerase sigma-70 factor (ECF subfamily)